MNRHDETDHIAEQVRAIDFAAALRREEEQMALRQADMAMSPWRVAIIWMAIGVVLSGGGVFAGWLAGWYGTANPRIPRGISATTAHILRTAIPTCSTSQGISLDLSVGELLSGLQSFTSALGG